MTPLRLVKDYSPEELAAFREQFRPVAEKYHRRSRVANIGMFAFFASAVLGMVLPKHLFMYFWSAGICSWLFGAFASPRTPDCPACHFKLDVGFGAYCPECGSRSLQCGDGRCTPRCGACNRRMTRSKGRRYNIRACTHCGVMLDETGL